jgi:hypothetical protein
MWDKAENIDFDFLEKITKSILAVANYLANTKEGANI